MTVARSSEEHLDKYCHAQRDGECDWKKCPQVKDEEPETTGRSCPLKWHEDEE